MIHVALGILKNEKNEVLVAWRPEHLYLGGVWEFPGGKLEAGESALQALKRELQEELGVEMLEALLLMKLEHEYPAKTVHLDAWQVVRFSGEARGCEGQAIRWVDLKTLPTLPFLEASLPIIQHLIRSE